MTVVMTPQQRLTEAQRAVLELKDAVDNAITAVQAARQKHEDVTIPGALLVAFNDLRVIGLDVNRVRALVRAPLTLAELDESTAPEAQMDRFTWTGWDEDGSTDAIPDKYLLTIEDRGEEFAVIVHRASAECSIDGPVADEKLARAELIVAALNAYAPLP